MTTELVLDTLEHASWSRRQAGTSALPGWSITTTPTARGATSTSIVLTIG